MYEVYIIGSLRNPEVPRVAQTLRGLGIPCFDSWHAVGPEADDYWREYEKARGHGYAESLHGWAGMNTFLFDKKHLDRCDGGVMVMPAGKSAHLELGYLRGQGKPAWILFDLVPERYDVMHNFATDIFFDISKLACEIIGELGPAPLLGEDL